MTYEAWEPIRTMRSLLIQLTLNKNLLIFQRYPVVPKEPHPIDFTMEFKQNTHIRQVGRNHILSGIIKLISE